MAAYGYLPPSVFVDGHTRTPDSQNLPFSGTINLDDVLVLSSGVLSQAATNAAVTTLAGLALKPSSAIYYQAPPAGNATLLGTSTVGTVLTPGYVKNMEFLPLQQGSYLEMSYVQALAAGTPGTLVGITLDATSTYFVADNAQANKVGTIVAVVTDALRPWVVGDTGARVLVQINAATAIG